MERTLDIFKDDAFSQATLRKRISYVPYTPTAIERLNLFNPNPITTEIVLIYEENGMIRLIPSTERGAPDIQAERQKGAFRALKTLRLSKKDTVRASELLGITDEAFPLSQRLQSAQTLVNRRMGQLRTDMSATKTLHMLGALQGKILDADGTTVLVDFFEMMGFAEPTPVEIDFSTITEDDLAVDMQTDFYVPMVRSLQTRNGGMGGDATGVSIAALCGDDFWAALMRHPAVREIWKAQQTGRAIAMAQNPLATPPIWDSIDFGNVRWFHFMGALTGPLRVPDDQAIIFPVNAPDVFEAYFSPGETLSQVQGEGAELYPMIRIDPRDDPEFMELFLRCYPLYACIYPQVLMRATLP